MKHYLTNESGVSPQMSLMLWHFDNANSTAKSSVVHRATQAPLVLLRIVDFDCFQIGRTVETTNGIQLAVDHSKSNLKR